MLTRRPNGWAVTSLNFWYFVSLHPGLYIVISNILQIIKRYSSSTLRSLMLQRLGRLHLYLTSISFWACWTDLNDPKYQVSCIATSSSPLVGIQIQPIAQLAWPVLNSLSVQFLLVLLVALLLSTSTYLTFYAVFFFCVANKWKNK